MDSEPLFLGFEASLADLSRSLERFEVNYQQLAKLNDQFVMFNGTFGQVLEGLQLASTCYDNGQLANRFAKLPTTTQKSAANTHPQLTKTAVSEPIQDENIESNIPQQSHEPEKKPPAQKRAKENGAGRTGGTKKVAFDTRKVISRCPVKYQNPPHRANVDIMLRLMKANPQGLYQNEIIDNCNISRNHCIEYINMFLRIGEVIRESRKGFIYKLHPKHYEGLPVLKTGGSR